MDMHGLWWAQMSLWRWREGSSQRVGGVPWFNSSIKLVIVPYNWGEFLNQIPCGYQDTPQTTSGPILFLGSVSMDFSGCGFWTHERHLDSKCELSCAWRPQPSEYPLQGKKILVFWGETGSNFYWSYKAFWSLGRFGGFHALIHGFEFSIHRDPGMELPWITRASCKKNHAFAWKT